MAVQRQTGAQNDAKPTVGDLRQKLYRFAKRVPYAGHPGSGFALCGAGQLAAGVIEEGKNAPQHTSVATGNQLKVVCGAPVAAGTRIASDANGEAITAVAGAEVLGQSINATAVAGEMLEIEFNPSGPMA
jgi:hypothetical protein